MIRSSDIGLAKQGNGLAVTYKDAQGSSQSQPVDMAILAPAVQPGASTPTLAKTIDLSLDEYGFFKEGAASSILSSKPGIYIVGCAQGAKNIQESVSQANAAVGKILSSSL